ncbi:hypothetical protein [Edwardsiella tarda]|uniref:hypothetical protein n=1 Tax=Edwardsiella tarda TaxID=636 RepID=UPI00083B941D|nr:hypothetical protein [Edwardsiella tarda]
MTIISDAEYLISSVSVEHTTSNFYTESTNYKGNAKGRGLHRMKFEFTIHMADADDIKKVEALMLRIRGRLNPFKLSLQDATDAKGDCNPLYHPAKPLLTAPAGIGNKTITINNFSGVIPAGSKFQFPNDTKVYTLLEDARTGKTVEIFPHVRIAHDAKSQLNFSPVPVLRLTGDSFTVNYERASELKLSALEVL